jgi:hypothetical protein
VAGFGAPAGARGGALVVATAAVVVVVAVSAADAGFGCGGGAGCGLAWNSANATRSVVPAGRPL